jgi:hypothetical protein
MSHIVINYPSDANPLIKVLSPDLGMNDGVKAFNDSLKALADWTVTGVSHGSTSLVSDPAPTLGADLNCHNYSITGLPNPTVSTAAISSGWANNAFLTMTSANNTYLTKTGGTLTGGLNANNYNISNLASPQNNLDAVSMSYCNSTYLTYSAGNNLYLEASNNQVLFKNNTDILLSNNNNILWNNNSDILLSNNSDILWNNNTYLLFNNNNNILWNNNSSIPNILNGSGPNGGKTGDIFIDSNGTIYIYGQNGWTQVSN